MLALSGCATFEKQKGHDRVAATVQERIGADTGWGEGSPDAEQISKRLDALLADGLTADEAVAIALLNNPSLQETYEELGVSQADLIQAGLLTNPSLDLSIGFPITPLESLDEHEFSLVQEFVDLFMLPLRKRVAEEQFVADALRVSHEALATAAEVKKELVATQAQTQLLALQRLALTAHELGSDLAQRQHKAGNITDLELAERRVAFEQARIDLSGTELSLTAQRERLNRLLGLWGPRTAWTLKDPLPDLPREELSLERLESIAIRQRLDIAAARKQVELMRLAADMARTWRYVGRVEVGAHTHQDANGPRLLGPTMVLELPLFDQRQAVIARLESQQRQSERKLAALSVNARSEVREARARLQQTRQLVLHLRAHVLPLRDQVVAQAQLQYNGMQIGLYQLLEAKQEQVESQRGYLEALRDYWTAHAELERLLGGRRPAAGNAAAAKNVNEPAPPKKADP
jgi:cobalt-zinc-cadmium efflux system outer membrane protein